MLPHPMPYFQDLKDPRRETKNKLHKLSDILMIVLCAVLNGIEDWVGMEEFAREKEAWLREFLALPNGIPSHDTLSDVLAITRDCAKTSASGSNKSRNGRI
jgi:hypothetical protein